MDFLLECIGFPPGHDVGELAQHVVAHGETVAWRGPSGVHLRLPLAGGLEVRLDREEGRDEWSLWPHFEVRRRLRVAVESVRTVPDSPFDALLLGQANPPLPGEEPGVGEAPGSYALATYLTDARRVPHDLSRGSVLAVSVAGFALDVTYVGPDEGVQDAAILETPHGARLHPTGDTGDPGGCMDVSLRVRAVRHLSNPVTGEGVEVLETDAPGRPIDLFLSRWQLQEEGFAAPRPGWRVEGAFVFSGRVSGGLPSPLRRKRSAFG